MDASSELLDVVAEAEAAAAQALPAYAPPTGDQPGLVLVQGFYLSDSPKVILDSQLTTHNSQLTTHNMRYATD